MQKGVGNFHQNKALREFSSILGQQSLLTHKALVLQHEWRLPITRQTLSCSQRLLQPIFAIGFTGSTLRGSSWQVQFGG